MYSSRTTGDKPDSGAFFYAEHRYSVSDFTVKKIKKVICFFVLFFPEILCLVLVVCSVIPAVSSHPSVIAFFLNRIVENDNCY